MIIRSKAPLRLGLAGGGSDVSPYSDLYSGLVLNATIDLYSYCHIQETTNSKIIFHAMDLGMCVEFEALNELPVDGILDIHKGVYNRIIKQFNDGKALSFKMVTYSDAPPGSGLGTSSTMVVAVIRAFVEWLNLPLGEYEVAHLAYEIERIDLALSGGKQDQYAATFGGFNFMEFFANDRVIVNPLRVKRWIIDELESSIILYNTGASRSSAQIINEQKKNTSIGNQVAIEAMHKIKQSAIDMKEAVLKGDIFELGNILGRAWENKKCMASSVSNPFIESIYDCAIKAGAYSGKISGAGGGGFIMFVVDPIKRLDVITALNVFHGKTINFHFTEGGCHSWKII